MANLCLADIWHKRLTSHAWSSRAAQQAVLSLAPSTINSYDRLIEKFVSFCDTKQVVFSEVNQSSVIAEFLCNIADSSPRPESQLRTAGAAISCLFEALDKPSPMHDKDIKRLVVGLVKTGTSKPMSRSKPMPVEPFINFFESWGDNTVMPIRQLRIKAVTLVALVFMARPSDLAPKGVVFNREKLLFEKTVMSVKDVIFHADGSMTLQFFGIKNDTTRTGFEVKIPRNHENKWMDPVSCLDCYISRTQAVRPSDTNPLFISLTRPYRAISADTISHILSEAIDLAGLGQQGYSAKSFRPTGATLAVRAGTTPETAMQIGRWKTKEVFLNHYVYPQAPESFTANVLGKSVQS